MTERLIELGIVAEAPHTVHLLARRNWVSACGFYPLTGEQVLEEVSRRVTQDQESIVLLDLDSTLYDVRPRTYQILIDWARSAQGSSFPEIQEVILRMNKSDIAYSLDETFHQWKFNLPPGLKEIALESLRQFWYRHFFSNSYLSFDQPYPGAAAFVQHLNEIGAKLVYLTGRDELNMAEGTQTCLKRDGFPLESSKSQLRMKPVPQLNDLEFKKAAVSQLVQEERIVASFENEPPNVVALYQLFPQAMHVFVDTLCSDEGAIPCHGLYRIETPWPHRPSISS